MVSPFTPMQYLAPCKVIRITEPGHLLLMEFGISRFGIRNSAQESGIPLRFGSGIHVALSCRNPQSTMWNPESKIVLDELSWSETSGHTLKLAIMLKMIM